MQEVQGIDISRDVEEWMMINDEVYEKYSELKIGRAFRNAKICVRGSDRQREPWLWSLKLASVY